MDDLQLTPEFAPIAANIVAHIGASMGVCPKPNQDVSQLTKNSYEY